MKAESQYDRKEEEKSTIPDFNRTQLHVMQVLWNAEKALKPSEIDTLFEWPIENATLRSVLAVMMDRGDIDREKKGKAFHYFPKRRKTAAMADMLGGLARIFGSESRVGLIAQLLQEDSLTPEESRQLREIAGELPADTPATNP